MNSYLEAVRNKLPEPLAPLWPLARNLRWTWDRPTRDAFRRINRRMWEAVAGSPIRFLETVDEGYLNLRAQQEGYLDWINALAAELEQYLSIRVDPKTAYFSLEFGLHEALPLYSGGLGVLAGDILKTFSGEKIGAVGVGLFYREGYFRQILRDGQQQHGYFRWRPEHMGFEAHDELVSVEIEGVTVYAEIWKGEVGRIPFLLLDTDVEQNNLSTRSISERLYGGNDVTRIKQEMLLGMGGYKALKLLGYEPDIYHLNEGHAAFAVVQHLEELASQGVDRDSALANTKSKFRFTTHTPVPAGIDKFHRHMLENQFQGQRHFSIDEIMELGSMPGDPPNTLNMMALAHKGSSVTSAVSKLHGKVSQAILHPLYPELKVEEVPVVAITNGVHPQTWVAGPMQELYEQEIGPEWYHASHEEWQRIRDVEPGKLWRARCNSRWQTIKYVRSELPDIFSDQDWRDDQAEWVDELFDPDLLLVGFARRFATYKRAKILSYKQFAPLKELLYGNQPAQFLLGGKAHPKDEDGQRIIAELAQFSYQNDVRRRIDFMPDYNMGHARSKVAGCDVWLNLPTKGQEASGTSGEKAVLNGSLHCSVLDGWWDECYDGVNANGFAIDTLDPDSEDPDSEAFVYAAENFFRVMREEVCPPFYERNSDGVPEKWEELMKESIASLAHWVSSPRMIHDYDKELYV